MHPQSLSHILSHLLIISYRILARIHTSQIIKRSNSQHCVVPHVSLGIAWSPPVPLGGLSSTGTTGLEQHCILQLWCWPNHPHSWPKVIAETHMRPLHLLRSMGSSLPQEKKLFFWISKIAQRAEYVLCMQEPWVWTLALIASSPTLPAKTPENRTLKQPPRTTGCDPKQNKVLFLHTPITQAPPGEALVAPQHWTTQLFGKCSWKCHQVP